MCNSDAGYIKAARLSPQCHTYTYMQGTCTAHTSGQRNMHDFTCMKSHTPPTCMTQVRHMHLYNYMHLHDPCTSHSTHMHHGTRTIHAGNMTYTGHPSDMHPCSVTFKAHAPRYTHDTRRQHDMHRTSIGHVSMQRHMRCTHTMSLTSAPYTHGTGIMHAWYVHA